MSKTYRPWKINQPLLLPVTVQDFVSDDHLARFVVELVVEHLDLSQIETAYASSRGQPPYDAAMMTAVLLYAYCNGVYSSRRIAKASRERVDFMSIVSLDAPDFRTISDFRKRHLKALADLFAQVLKLCEHAGLVKLGHVALDGTKIKANASKHKAMSYARMEERAAALDAEVERWMGAAAAADAAEDRALAKTRAARRRRPGSRTRRSAPKRSGRRRRNWRPRRKPPPRPRPKRRPKLKKNAWPKAAREEASLPHSRRIGPVPKHRRTSLIPRAAS